MDKKVRYVSVVELSGCGYVSAACCVSRLGAQSLSISLSLQMAAMRHTHTHTHTNIDAHVTFDRGHATVTEITQTMRVIDHLANVSNLDRRMRWWRDDERVGGLEEKLAAAAWRHLLLVGRERVTSVRQRRLNYLSCVPPNEHIVPGVRKGVGRYFITGRSGTGICLYSNIRMLTGERLSIVCSNYTRNTK